MIETVAHFLDPKDQLALHGTHSSIKDVLKDQFLMKAKALNETCPRWLIRKAFGNVWSIFTTITLSTHPNPDVLSLSCLRLMNTHIDMIRNVKTLHLVTNHVTSNYLDALGELLSNKDFTQVKISNYQRNFPIDRLFQILRNARIETLELYIPSMLPSRDAFENLALNKNIKHLKLNEEFFPLFLNSFQNFQNLQSINCDIHEALNQTAITKLYQFPSLRSIYLRKQSINNQEMLLSIESPFNGFAISINGTENAIIEKPLVNLKLDLQCYNCELVVLNLENSFHTLVTLEIEEYNNLHGLNYPFLSDIFQHSTALDSLFLVTTKPSRIMDLLPFSLDLKTFSLYTWDLYEMNFGPLIEFISTQDHLEHFEIRIDSTVLYRDVQPILVPILKALQTRIYLKTIQIEFIMAITTDEMNVFVPVFIDAISGFSDINILINGVRVKDIIERMKGDKIPLDIVRSSKVSFIQ